MIKKTIVLATHLEACSDFSLTDPTLKKRYPGSGWIKWLHDLCMDAGYEFKTSTQALAEEIDPANILLIQEDNNRNGIALQQKGAKPRLNFCLESPLYAWDFYDHFEEYTKPFAHKMALGIPGAEQAYFPSFDYEDIIEDLAPLDPEKRLVMVCSNKHYSMQMPQQSHSFWKAVETQNHDYRYLAINYFKRFPWFKLYGKGWANMAEACEDKLKETHPYQFSLVIENYEASGYFTEKYIDALVAGCFPLYFGHAIDYYRGFGFIDYGLGSFFDRKQRPLPYVLALMDSIESSDRARKCFNNSRLAWLYSQAGAKFTNQNFAATVFNKAINA